MIEGLTFKSDFDVATIQQCGSDEMVAMAARVSVGRDSEVANAEKVQGLIAFLMSNRHGTPFEHGMITLRINAPIFVWREFHRHRIGFSYNEQSGRYMKLAPVFYVPCEERRTVSIKPEGFKPSSPSFHLMEALAQDDWHSFWEAQKGMYESQYQQYLKGLALGMDNGLARANLPVGLYSACYVTANPRSLMAFLELRTDEYWAKRRSHPLWEMHQVAKKVEEEFARFWPITHKLWNAGGRMAP